MNWQDKVPFLQENQNCLLRYFKPTIQSLGAVVYVTGRSISRQVATEKEIGGSLEEVVDEISKFGGTCIPIKVDHSCDTDVNELFAIIEKNHKKLDILVNNAFQVPVPPGAVSEEEKQNALFLSFW